MLELVTKAEARYQLRLDEPDSSGDAPDDPWLELFIPAISEAVALWLKESWRLYVPELDSDGAVVVDSAGDPVPALDSNGDPIVRYVVKAAVLVELASQTRFREGEGKDNVVENTGRGGQGSGAGYGYVLNKVSTALLTPLRRSTVA